MPIPDPTDQLFGQPISMTEDAASCAAALTRHLERQRAALVTDFPPDPAQYIELLTALGRPLDNYAGEADNAAYALHRKINVVKCAPPAAGPTRVQERSGPLPAHSSRAFSNKRPRFIAMLMIDSGWQDLPSGSTGESTAVRWRDVIRWMRRNQPDTFPSDFQLLTQTPICIMADHVVDEWSQAPLLYPLYEGIEADDLGARLSLVLWDQLPKMSMSDELRARYIEAVSRFAAASNDPAIRHTYRLRSGQIAILDNNRFGHGRCAVVATRTGPDDTTDLNPRELWSVTVA